MAKRTLGQKAEGARWTDGTGHDAALARRRRSGRRPVLGRDLRWPAIRRRADTRPMPLHGAWPPV